jgi:hypothetical protein
MKKFLSSAAVLVVASCVWAQTVPSGWKVVKGGFTPFPGQNLSAAPDACRIAVPADWTSFIMSNNVHEPHSMGFTATVTASKPGISFAEQVRSAKSLQKMSPVKGKTVVEDSAKRFWTETKSGSATEWNVTAPGNPNCDLDLSFSDAADEATAKKIVMSLGPTK